jgi:hypothetical protein
MHRRERISRRRIKRRGQGSVTGLLSLDHYCTLDAVAGVV